MSSRQEEKERRKREREQKQQAEKASAARRKRLQMIIGVVLAVVVLGGGTALALGLGGDGGGGDSGEPREAAEGGAPIPERAEADLKKAAEAAGCKLVDAPNEGNGHEEKDFKAADYQQNPPTSGNHFPEWYQDGIYEAGGTPELGKLVHTLEHGRIDIQYKPGTPANTVAQLETLYNEMDGGYHLLLFENGTNMPFAVAATAWEASLGCPTMNPQVFDAIRAFSKEHINKGPETVP